MLDSDRPDGIRLSVADAGALGETSLRRIGYVELMVRAGLVGIHTASARPHVLPPGGRRPALGTNPISIGFPSTDGPVIYDIGTASLMWGEVLLMARLGEILPESVGFDADGNAARGAAAVARDGGGCVWRPQGLRVVVCDPGAEAADRGWAAGLWLPVHRDRSGNAGR
jgi:hypothetical protein